MEDPSLPPLPPPPPPPPPPAPDDQDSEENQDGDDTGELETESAGRASSSRSQAKGPFVVNTAACNGKSAKDLFSAVAAQLGWRERDVEVRPSMNGAPRVGPKGASIVCVMQTSDMLERLPMLRRGSYISRYVGLSDLCDKGNFARAVLACQDLTEPDVWSFNPKTWVLPDQRESLRQVLSKSKKTYIVKPEDGSQGDGIFLVQGLRDLDIKLSTKPSAAAVVQRYIEKPLLLGGVKFDLRLYVCLIGGSSESPPLTFLCREGLARFCTENYEEPTSKNMHQCMAHLTNYSLNKRSDKFEHSGQSLDEVFDPGSGASKRPLTAVLARLEAEHPDFSSDTFYESVSALVQTWVATMAPVLVHYRRGVGEVPGSMHNSFQVLGFDVMMDREFRPFLLEVNNSPSLCIDEALPLEEGDPRLEERGGRPGRPREKEGKVCLCMDMAQPHVHRTSLVDLTVKATAMVGVFRLLEQLKRGEDPEVDEYVSVDVSSDGLWHLLQRVESFYNQCGGGQKAFSGSTMRRMLGPLAGQGGLEKHDLDTAAIRFRSSQFANRDRSLKPDALRLFDFVDLLRHVGRRAFPTLDGAALIDHMLSALGA